MKKNIETFAVTLEGIGALCLVGAPFLAEFRAAAIALGGSLGLVAVLVLAAGWYLGERAPGSLETR